MMVLFRNKSGIPYSGYIYAQLKNYLKCTNKELGMLINFGAASLSYKRIINLKNSH
ncbi:hypothetical protein B6A10_15340 [Flavobacterium sp. L1I52]|uniref:GxxExxY protein n=1 Tax=Flavobacterium pokkalii TaxID=1940408 RepID=A0ABR7UW94_9FLAO|nr:GxxExxY protein [Flavobacterium pokkalii]MBD0726546.1 hypothetical protein [Flavobacterium pokkalii]